MWTEILIAQHDFRNLIQYKQYFIQDSKNYSILQSFMVAKSLFEIESEFTIYIIFSGIKTDFHVVGQ